MFNYNIISLDGLSVNDVALSIASKVRERRIDEVIAASEIKRKRGKKS